MSSVRWLVLVCAVALCAPRIVTAEGANPKRISDVAPPSYASAQVVEIDLIGRTLVIRNAKGVEEKVELDDSLAGFGDIKTGDRVILTLRTGPGWARVTSIAKSKVVPAPKFAAHSPAVPPLAPVNNSLAFRETFGAQVASLAGQADRVDRVWNEFQNGCDFQTGNSPHEGGRGWFAIWEGSLRADLSSGFCRDLFNQIVDLGEPIKSGMTAAEDAVQRKLLPGEIREIRRRSMLDWEGWTLPAPKKLER